LHAIVEFFGDINIIVAINGEVIWAIKLTIGGTRCAKRGYPIPGAIEFLDAVVVGVGDP
jgi:hypothetical protein